MEIGFVKQQGLIFIEVAKINEYLHPLHERNVALRSDNGLYRYMKLSPVQCRLTFRHHSCFDYCMYLV